MTDTQLKNYVQFLYSQDEHYGRIALSVLLGEIQTNPKVYHYIDLYIKMLDHSNPNIRRRALAMIDACSSMDTNKRIEASIQKILSHISDENLIVSRECVHILPGIVSANHSLAEPVFDKLIHANISAIDKSMQTFMQNEIYSALKQIIPYKNSIPANDVNDCIKNIQPEV